MREHKVRDFGGWWGRLSTVTKVVFLGVILSPLVLIIYLGVRESPAPAPSSSAGRLIGQRACVGALDALTSALKGTATPQRAAAAMEAAAEPLGPAAAEYPRLAVIALAVEQSRKEVISGKPTGEWSTALIRECGGVAGTEAQHGPAPGRR